MLQSLNRTSKPVDLLKTHRPKGFNIKVEVATVLMMLAPVVSLAPVVMLDPAVVVVMLELAALVHQLEQPALAYWWAGDWEA
jgi:hypothetical protein